MKNVRLVSARLLVGVATVVAPCAAANTTFETGNTVGGVTPAAELRAAQGGPAVSASVVAVGDRKYAVYDYADPATKKFRVVVPAGLKTVRGLLVECNYAGGDSRSDWTFCHYYREFMHLHDFGLVASAG